MAVTIALLALAGRAQGDPWEVTLFGGVGAGGEFEEDISARPLRLADTGLRAVALDLDIGDDAGNQYELYLSHQETRLVGNNLLAPSSAFDLDIDYYHLGGTLLLGSERLHPYIVGTVGVTYLDPGSTLHESSLRPSLSLGGGLRFFPVPNIGLRLEGRAIGTLTDGSGAIISDSGGLSIYVRGDGFLQFQLSAGLIIRIE